MPQSKIWEAFLQCKSISTDTRKIQSGDLFFALKGDNFDGNKFAQQALQAGAAFVVVSDAQIMPENDARYLLVADTLISLQQLGRQFRETFSIPFIGITGSNGKTTTKELIHAVLSSEKRAYATTGNLNNHIGVPLTLLAMPSDIEIAVIEMGANKPKDIEELVNIALPSHGVITNIGNAHLEGMGGIEGVQRTKGEMFDFLKANDGFAFVNEGDPRVAEIGKSISHQIGYGGKSSAYQILETQSNSQVQRIQLQTPQGTLSLESQLLGAHNAENVMLAVAVGQHFGISNKAIQQAIANYVPRMNRSQLHVQNGRTFLLDAYNANPSSMEATIRSIADQNPAAVALILGDMFELGPTSAALHAGIWEIARKALPEATIIGIGHHFHAEKPAADAKAFAYENVDQALIYLAQDLADAKFILLKGSRGMALERLLPSLGVTL
jgi:UDP-N-acetylmuramoyl-tripeptide--D-alanyl-D-alanine ligase